MTPSPPAFLLQMLPDLLNFYHLYTRPDRQAEYELYVLRRAGEEIISPLESERSEGRTDKEIRKWILQKIYP